MYEVIRSLPEQIKQAFETGKSQVAGSDAEKVVICGMGGSAIAGLILMDYMKTFSSMPVFVCNTYDIPKFVDEKSLVFISSYSGDTEETINCYTQAKKTGCEIIIMTSGGKLGGMDGKKIMLPDVSQPRYAIGASLFSMLGSLQASGIIPAQDKFVKEVYSVLKAFDEKAAKEIAKRLENRIPLIYASDVYAASIYRWRTDINENSKSLAFQHVLPEMNHNEINAFVSKRPEYHVVMVRDKKDHPRIAKRFEITKKIIGPFVDVSEVWVKGDSMLARISYVVYFGSMMSICLADLKGVDAEKVDVIKRLKEELK